MKLSILMPVYNELKTLPEILAMIDALPIEKELIIVDDGSTDGSRDLEVKKCMGKEYIKIILHEYNMGKGAAIKTAISAATGEVAIIQDADLEYDVRDYARLIEPIREGSCDVVYGSRFLESWRSTSFLHFLVNKTVTVITNVLFGSNLTDMETCYKMMRTDIFKSINIESQHFEIEAEITAKLIKQGYKILEVPISYKGRSYHEGKKLGWRDGFAALWALYKYRFLR